MDFRLGVTILIIFSAFVDAKPSRAMEELKIIEEKRQLSSSSSSSPPTKWILIQQKTSGSDGGLFDANGWDGYKHGFGNSSDGDYWLGLERLHELTSTPQSKWQLLIKYHYTDKQGGTITSKYNDFRVESEMEDFRLGLGSLYDAYGVYWRFTGYNRFSELSGSQFSTKDRDNDVYISTGISCAAAWGGGFWFQHNKEPRGNYCLDYQAPTSKQSNVVTLMAIRRIDSQ